MVPTSVTAVSPVRVSPKVQPSRVWSRFWARFTDDTGQTTAEYALVLLGVAAIAMLVLAWAGQTDRINGLFDAVLDSITGLVP